MEFKWIIPKKVTTTKSVKLAIVPVTKPVAPPISASQ